ncbi:hypothetical protein V1264_015542 [Littorina saxatilis]
MHGFENEREYYESEHDRKIASELLFNEAVNRTSLGSASTEHGTFLREQHSIQQNDGLVLFTLKEDIERLGDLQYTKGNDSFLTEGKSKRFCHRQQGTRPLLEEDPHNNSQHENGDSDSDNKEHQQENKQKKTFSGCACQCRMSDRAKSGRFNSKHCRFQWKAASTWIRSPGLTSSPISSDSYSGKRCKKLASQSWIVDTSPNHKGQAKRNGLKFNDLNGDLCGVKPTIAHGKGHKGTVDLLLMSEDQRKGGDGSGHGNIIQRYLVSLAVIFVLLGDFSRQKTPILRVRLLSRPGACQWTLKMDMDQNKLVDAVRNFFRCKALEDSFEYSSCNFSSFHDAYKTNVPILDPKLMARLSHQQRMAVVFPATGFLPSMTSGNSNFLDHVGYRLASLAALPSSCSLSRVRLADAGFHFNPRSNPSAVVCHKCGAALSLDTSTEDATFTSALAFHRQSSPHCSFLTSVLDQFTEMPLGSATDSSGVAHQTASVSLTQPAPVSFASRQVGGTDHADGRDISEDGEGAPPGPNNNRQTLPNSLPSRGYTLAPSNTHQSSTVSQQPRQAASAGRQVRDSAEERPQLDLGSAVYPQFSTAQSRLATFQNWPLLNVFLPQTLVSLGFYYAGYADCVRCFYCGVGLKSWDENDDPLVEHVRWRPQCVYLLATKGRQHIHSVINRTGNTNSQNDSEHLSSTLPQSQQHQTAPTSSTSTTGITTARDGHGARTGSERSPYAIVRQQLLTMGFSVEDIDRAQEQLGNTGGPEVLDNLLAILMPERS